MATQRKVIFQVLTSPQFEPAIPLRGASLSFDGLVGGVSLELLISETNHPLYSSVRILGYTYLGTRVCGYSLCTSPMRLRNLNHDEEVGLWHRPGSLSDWYAQGIHLAPEDSLTETFYSLCSHLDEYNSTKMDKLG